MVSYSTGVRSFKKAVVLAAVVVIVLVPAAHYLWWGCRSPECGDSWCHSVRRKHFPFRHWQWSGIPVVEGGFVPDPHYLWSETAPFPKSVNEMLSVKDSRYAILGVNPFFDDSSSEILLLVEATGKVFEYSLRFPKDGRVQAILGVPMPPPAMTFPYKGNVAILASFFGANGLYLMPLPLRSGVTLRLIPTTNPELATIAAAFRSVGQEFSMRNQFASRVVLASLRFTKSTLDLVSGRVPISIGGPIVAHRADISIDAHQDEGDRQLESRCYIAVDESLHELLKRS